MKKFDKIASGIILLVVLSEIVVSFSLIGFEGWDVSNLSKY